MTNRALQSIAAAGAALAVATAALVVSGTSAPAQGPQQTAIVSELSLRLDRLEELVRRLNGEIEELRHRLGEDVVAEAAAPPAAPAPPAPVAPRAAAAPPPPPRPAAPAETASLPAPEAVPNTLGRTLAAAPSRREARLATGAPRSLLPPTVGSALAPAAAPRPAPTATAALPAPPAPAPRAEPIPEPRPQQALRGAQGAEPLPPPSPAPSQPAPEQAQQLAATPTVPGAEAAYDTAYGRVLNGENAAAENAFADFLERYPRHALAGNAQYWLGEIHYARGEYRRAAQAFLKGYKDYPNSDKASDSLLKLGMSLAELGETVQACASLGEISQKYAGARAAVRERAAEERLRLGC